MIGARLVAVREVTEAELEEIGCGSSGRGSTPMMLVFNNGVKLTALMDPEGNGVGTMIWLDKKSQFYVTPE